MSSSTTHRPAFRHAMQPSHGCTVLPASETYSDVVSATSRAPRSAACTSTLVAPFARGLAETPRTWTATTGGLSGWRVDNAIHRYTARRQLYDTGRFMS